MNNEKETLAPVWPPCPDGCNKTSHEFANVTLPVELVPSTHVGPVTTNCIGEPNVRCEANPCANTVRIVISQRLKVTIPVTIRVHAVPGAGQINCGPCGCDGPVRED